MQEINITLGDLRQSSEYTSDTDCPLALCAKRQIEGATHVSTHGIYAGDPGATQLGTVFPHYWAEDYRRDMQFMNDPKSEDLPDMHVVRTLQYTPLTTV